MPLLAALACLLAGGGSRAADPLALAAILTTHPRLEQLRACYQAEKDELLAERRAVLEKTSGLEAFRRSLTDEPRQAAARERTDRALTEAREAAARLDGPLAMADRKIAMAVRVLKTLDPDDSAARPQSPEERRRAVNWLTQAAHESRGIDKDLAIDYGFENGTVLVERLTGLIDGLQVASARPDTPLEVKILTKDSGLRAVATATTLYLDKAYLDRKPSDAELLFVASHELAHVQLGHFSEALIALARDRREKAVSDGSKKALAMLLERRWTRRQEEMADLLGVLQALEAGASPQGIRDAIKGPEARDRLRSLEAVLGDKFWERTDLKFGDCPR